MKIFIPRTGDILTLNQELIVEVHPYRQATREIKLTEGTELKVNSLDGRYNNINLRLKGEKELISIPIRDFNGVDCELNIKQIREVHSLIYPENARRYSHASRSTSKAALVGKLRKWGGHRMIFASIIDPLLEARCVEKNKSITYGSGNNQRTHLQLTKEYKEQFDIELRQHYNINNWEQILDNLPVGYSYEVKELVK